MGRVSVLAAGSRSLGLRSWLVLLPPACRVWLNQVFSYWFGSRQGLLPQVWSICIDNGRQYSALPPESLATTSGGRQAAMSASQLSGRASDGMRQSPLGESATFPTFGPSAVQERLN